MKNFLYGFLTCFFLFGWVSYYYLSQEPQEGFYWLDYSEVYQVKALRQMRKDGTGFILHVHKNDWLNPDSVAFKGLSGCFIDNGKINRRPIDSLDIFSYQDTEFHNRIIDAILETVDREYHK